MKLVNLIKVGNTPDDTTLFISAGDGYFPRFGYHPVPINEVYKFADSDKLYVWDGTLLRTSEPEEGDIAYGLDGKFAATFKDGWWMLQSAPRIEYSMGEEIEYSMGEETDGEVYALRIGNVTMEVDPVKFVADNRDLIEEIVSEYLRETSYINRSGDNMVGTQSSPAKDNTLVSIFASLRMSLGVVRFS